MMVLFGVFIIISCIVFFLNFIHSGTFGKTSPPHGDLEMALLINGSLFCCLSVV